MSEMNGGGTAAATTGSSSGGDAGSIGSGTSTPAPPSTADVARQVIEADDGAADDGIEVSGDLPMPPAEGAAEAPRLAAAKPPTTAPPAALSVEEQLLQEFGFTQKFKPDGREYYLPRSRVLQMISTGLKRGQEKWGTERQAMESQLSQHQQHMAQLVAGVRGDPRAFLAELASHDPRYQEFLGPQPQGRREAPSPPLPFDDMPQPDLPLSDGSATYSLQGIQQQLIPWLTQAIATSIKKDLHAERQQEEQTRQQRQQLTQQSQQKVMALMQEATTWPLFGAISPDGKLSPFQTEVMQVFMADKSLDLRAAYMKVAHPKLTTDRNKMREELLAELNGAPRSTAVAHQGTERRPAGPRTTADFAAAAIDRLERG